LSSRVQRKQTERKNLHFRGKRIIIKRRRAEMLDYTVVENTLKPGAGYRAQVVGVRSRTRMDIIERILGKAPGFKAHEVEEILDAETEAVAAIVAEGDAVNTDLYAVYPGVRGSIAAGGQDGEAPRLSVHANMQPGAALKAAAAKVKLRKTAPRVSGTLIVSVTDAKTGEINGIISPGHNIVVTGQKLSVQGDDPACGVYFTPVKDAGKPAGAKAGSRTASSASRSGAKAVKAKKSDIIVNKPSGLIILVPPLAAGQYQLEVWTQYTAGTPAKAVKKVRFDKELQVE
jgi:hypothetical protein